MGRYLIALLVTLAVAAGAVSPVLADPPTPPPPTLTGEEFLTTNLVIVSASCDPNDTSTISFTASGTAIGPYPGPFTVAGTFAIGKEQFPGIFGPGGFIQSFSESFSIDSPTGQVTGTKTSGPQGTLGECNTFSNVPGVGSGVSREAEGTGTSYEAEIRTDSGTFFDVGVSRAFVVDIEGSIQSASVFREDFFSSLTRTISPPGESGLLKPGCGRGDDNHLHTAACP